MVKVGGKLRDCRMWTGLGGDGRTAVFVYNRHRSGAAALSFLEGSSPGDYLMIDDCPYANSERRLSSPFRVTDFHSELNREHHYERIRAQKKI